MKTVAIVTCYKDPDYIRAVTLRQALAKLPNYQPLIIKNQRRGPLRYIEMLGRLLWVRLRRRPDIWLLTFRGYELLPLVLLLAGRRPVIYDEFINPFLVTEEHRAKYGRRPIGQLMRLWSLLRPPYRWLLKRCVTVLLDTEAHADYSAHRLNLPRRLYASLPVAADEQLYAKTPMPPPATKLKVFTYGSGQQLHGLQYIVQAAELLKDEAVEFVIAGGDRDFAAVVKAAQTRGAKIVYHRWLATKDLIEQARASHLTLGGPFGTSRQAGLVITGKTYQFLALGRPVVVGATANHQLFIDRQNCLVVERGSAQQLADAISWAASHQGRLADIAEAGHQLYQANFSIDRLAELLEPIVDRLS